jgi:cyclic beta-1,2-glucan synthetase
MTPRVPAHWSGFRIELKLGNRTLALQHGELPDGGDATHRLVPGEWVVWRTLPEGSVLQIDRS